MRSLVGALLSVRNEAPVPYVGRGYSGHASWAGLAGAEQQMRAMGSTGILFSIVDRLATSTASPAWKLFREGKPNQRPEDRVEVTSHAALDILRRPNRFFTRQLLIETAQQHYELVGEGWLVVTRHPSMRSIPLELWPVLPFRMTPVPDRDNYLVGYVYTSPDGEQIPLELDEVIFTRRPNPVDVYRGIGAVQTILTDLEGIQLSAEWNRNFFRNSAEPGGIVQVDKRLSDGEFREMVQRWREQHQGVANAHRVAILEQGQWVDRKITQRDMQFAELRDVSRDVIREAFGITKFAIGDVEDINRATGEAAKTWFAEQMTVPRLERWKQALNTQFLPLFGTTGKGVEFDYESPVPEDEDAENAALTAKSAAYKTLTDAGVDHDAAAQVVGLPPMKIRVVTPVVVAPPAAPPAPAPAVEPATARAALTAPVRAAGGERLPEQPNLTPVQESWSSALDGLLNQWASVWSAWIGALVDQVRALIAAGDRAGLIDIEVPQGDIDHAAAIIKAAMAALAHEAADQVVAEARDQDVELSAGMVDEDALGDTAAVVAHNLAREASVDASREAMHQSPPDVIGDQEAQRISKAVRQRLTDHGDEDHREWLGNALTQAQHSGRVATFKGGEGTRDVPVPAYYASEKNDGHTCVFCREVNGRWLGNSIAAAEAEYPSGGYARCLGGIRCRGEVVAVWRPKQVGGDE